MIYLLVEGLEDKRFFEKVLKNQLMSKYGQFFIWEYAQKKKEKVQSFIDSLISMQASFILIHDMDKPSSTLQIAAVRSLYKRLNSGNIWIVKKEIESWYLAGIGLDHPRLRPNSSVPHDTEEVDKERFVNMLKGIGKTEALLEISTDFDIEFAKTRNKSFDNFIQKYC